MQNFSKIQEKMINNATIEISTFIQKETQVKVVEIEVVYSTFSYVLCVQVLQGKLWNKNEQIRIKNIDIFAITNS